MDEKDKDKRMPDLSEGRGMYQRIRERPQEPQQKKPPEKQQRKEEDKKE